MGMWGNYVASAPNREVISGYWFERKGNYFLLLRLRKTKASNQKCLVVIVIAVLTMFYSGPTFACSSQNAVFIRVRTHLFGLTAASSPWNSAWLVRGMHKNVENEYESVTQGEVNSEKESWNFCHELPK